jgi:hypothetical protein
VYVGPLAVTLRRVKARVRHVRAAAHARRTCLTLRARAVAQLLSLSSLLVTVVGAPALVFQSAPEAVSVAAKIALSSSVIAFGCFTTGALQPAHAAPPAGALTRCWPGLLSWFASPYVLRLALGSGGTAEITTLTLLARPETRTIRLSEMKEPQTLRPLATFAAQGRIFFVDGNVADTELLARLGLQKKTVAAPQTGYDSDDEDDDAPAAGKRKA